MLCNPRVHKFTNRCMHAHTHEHCLHLHYTRRVEGLLSGGGRIELGGDSDEDDLYIAPTIIVDVTNDDAIMQEEVH